MKKIKVMLTGIAIFAVIGGTIAFKAKNAFGWVIYTSVRDSDCTVQNLNKTFGSPNIIGVYYTTNPFGSLLCYSTRVLLQPAM